MPDSGHDKSQLRAILRQRRQDLSAERQETAANALARQIGKLPQWPGANQIALYLPTDGEIDTAAIVALCRQQDKQIFLPVIASDKTLSFALWNPNTQLIENRYGIAEPPQNAHRCPAEKLDIIFMPLVGWDRQGGRLGMGGGFYDRSLDGVSGPTLVGLAHSLQEVDFIPRESWDIGLDFIATDSALHKCQGIDSR